MCHFITLVFSRDTKLDEVEEIFVRRLHTLCNPNVQAQLEAGELYVQTSGRHCDCGTVIGSARVDQEPSDKKLNAQVAKLKRKGWGQAKIEKWLENKRHASEKQARVAKVHADMVEASGEAARWIGSLTDVVDAGAAAYVGLLLHWYSGDLHDEEFEIQRWEKVSLQDVRPGDLGHFEEDVLYVFGY